MSQKQHETPSNRLSKRQRATRGLEKHPALVEWIKVFLASQPWENRRTGQVPMVQEFPDGTVVSIKIQTSEPDETWNADVDWTLRALRTYQTVFKDRRYFFMPPHRHLLEQWIAAFWETGPKPNNQGWVWWKGTVEGRAVKISIRSPYRMSDSS